MGQQTERDGHHVSSEELFEWTGLLSLLLDPVEVSHQQFRRIKVCQEYWVFQAKEDSAGTEVGCGG